jgi:hypothetical protein
MLFNSSFLFLSISSLCLFKSSVGFLSDNSSGIFFPAAIFSSSSDFACIKGANTGSVSAGVETKGFSSFSQASFPGSPSSSAN